VASNETGVVTGSDEFAALWASLDPAKYPGAGPGTAPTSEMSLMHDAVQVAHRAHYRLARGLAATPAAAVREQRFVGATGGVALDTNGDRLGMPMRVLNVVVDAGGAEASAVLKPVLEISPGVGGAVRDLAPIVWPGTVDPQVGSLIAGKVFRAATKISPPFVMREMVGGEPRWSGLIVDLVRHIETELECTIELTLEPSLTYNGVIDAVARGDYDMFVGDPVITRERLEKVRFTLATVQTNLAIVERRRTPGTDIFRFTSPFQSFVWIALLFSLLVGAAILPLFERGHTSPINDVKHPKWLEAFWYCASCLTAGQQFDLGSFGGRAFALGWQVVALLLTTFYTASLTASLTAERVQKGIAGVDDLVNVPTGVIGGGSVSAYAEGVPLRDLRYHESLEEMFVSLGAGTIDAFIADALWVKVPLRSRCEFALAGGAFSRSLWGFAVSPAFQHLPDINRVISDAWDSELVSRTLMDKWLGSEAENPCGTEAATGDFSAEGLRIGDFYGIYVVYLSSIAIGAISTLVWMAVRRAKARRSAAATPVSTTTSSKSSDVSGSTMPTLASDPAHGKKFSDPFAHDHTGAEDHDNSYPHLSDNVSTRISGKRSSIAEEEEGYGSYEQYYE
jgi:polar amino acid transport system substrate-binding protein